MPALLIKDFPPKLHRKLKAAAAREHRSMTGQALALLEEALRANEEALEASEEGIPPLPPPFKGRFPLTNQFINRAKRAGRL